MGYNVPVKTKFSAAVAASVTAPPSLAPQVINTSGSGRQVYTLSNVQNAVLVQTGSEVRERLYVIGGGDVTILGTDIRPTSHDSSSALYVKNTARSVTIEGVRIDNARAGEHDGIGLDGGEFRPDVVIRATSVRNVRGSYEGFHGDVIQSHGGLGSLTVTDFVGTTNYQGIFLGDAIDTKAPGIVNLDNVYMGYADGPNRFPVLLWLGNGSSTIETSLTNVTLDSRAASRGSDFGAKIFSGETLLKGVRNAGDVRYDRVGGDATISFGDEGAVTATAEGDYDWKAGLASALDVERVQWGSSRGELLVAGAAGAGLFGNAGADTLRGSASHDYLDGGAGADTMIGGLGDDVYVVDSLLDVIVETPGSDGGHDTVLSSISYRLGDHVENLQLTGANALDGWGNALDNVIVGGLGANSLVGGAGNDKLYGAEGNDALDGDDGNDLLDGGIGADVMRGGAGDDTYMVDDSGDQVVEDQGGGVDAVFASISYTLGGDVEHLVLTGAKAIDAMGNQFDNLLVGNDAVNTLKGLIGDDTLLGGGGDDVLDGGWGDDLLDGGVGADRMTGGSGNDIYLVDNAGDRIIEWASKGGIDTVVSSIDYTLQDNLENLALRGSRDLVGSGNKGNNVLSGGAGNDVLLGQAGNDTLNGGAGSDQLWGGSGKDTFVFRAGEAQGDHVFDFAKGDKLVFQGFGSGAYVTRVGAELSIHDDGKVETIWVDGPLSSADWSFTALDHNAADLARAAADYLAW
ncbi:calcium-binding protein [Sphingomonas sp. BK235]|uniref:calcium-binding protein n=1 Tax=Sphingomonas sp. BK235 TaxID=2512131 RepID=UPI001042A146|nr:calcium-binding protein [Sphingomonas sp. BK235]TCP36092.1 hemolysin type calcium-binding protein [Sphingomonas sp. BK235]